MVRTTRPSIRLNLLQTKNTFLSIFPGDEGDWHIRIFKKSERWSFPSKCICFDTFCLPRIPDDDSTV